MEAMMNKKLSLVFILFVAVTIPRLHAHIGDYDSYWMARAEQAKTDFLSSYHPEPEEVTNHFNRHVALAVEKHNNTRRSLGEVHHEECNATNPIDQCWRCDPNWEKNRKKLADCVLGFGRNTTGGKDGPFYVVTDPSDDDVSKAKEGTIRHAVTRNGPLWIIFQRSMVITLKQELIITANKTIDGRGANVQIRNGCGLTLQFVDNVIVHNIHIHDIITGEGGIVQDSEDHQGLRTKSDGDGINVFGATNIWLDHLSLSNCTDGIIDVIMASTAITISNLHVTDHDEVMLFGHSDSLSDDKKMQITVCFNHFGKRLVQRMPRCRWGLIHVVNNDYTHWMMYAIGGSSNPTIISQGNRFIGPPNDQAKQVTKREYTSYATWKNWVWRSERDYFMNGAYFVQTGKHASVDVIPKEDVIVPVPGQFVSLLTKDSGTIICTPGKPC